jgi:hypothetical protein
MINVPEVTLLAISSIEIPATIRAIERSCLDINFGAVKLITHEKPENLPHGISFEKCPKINDIMDFNEFTFKYLGGYVNTSHCLMVQYHAYIINPWLWLDEWLEYDYIGAPWAIKDDAYIAWEIGEHVRVGNGGFSLRSKKLMDIPIAYNIPLTQEQGYYNEDGNICCYHRKKMLDLGIKYAPVETAARFSYENTVPENKGIQSFGFHRNQQFRKYNYYE